jgi:O-methyltransferase involved in polyketide biosynthesis
MRPNQSSLTAMGTAAQRAIEMERPVKERICCDPIARQFLSAWFLRFDEASHCQRLSSETRLERILGSGGLPGYVTFVPVDSTLAFVASHSAPGSAIVFDYMW